LVNSPKTLDKSETALIVGVSEMRPAFTNITAFEILAEEPRLQT
jgi:hypothetical protein